MHKDRSQIAVSVATEFLNRSFASGETIAILLRRVLFNLAISAG